MFDDEMYAGRFSRGGALYPGVMNDWAWGISDIVISMVVILTLLHLYC